MSDDKVKGGLCACLHDFKGRCERPSDSRWAEDHLATQAAEAATTERALIVAWLRVEAASWHDSGVPAEWIIRQVADAIERGDHTAVPGD